MTWDQALLVFSIFRLPSRQLSHELCMSWLKTASVLPMHVRNRRSVFYGDWKIFSWRNKKHFIIYIWFYASSRAEPTWEWCDNDVMTPASGFWRILMSPPCGCHWILQTYTVVVQCKNKIQLCHFNSSWNNNNHDTQAITGIWQPSLHMLG